MREGVLVEVLFYAGLIVLFAAVLQACTGFGFSIMATPFLLLIYDPRMAIQLNIILSLFISMAMLPKIHDEIDRALLLRLIKGSAFGAPLGIAVFALLNVAALKVAISVLIIFLTILLALRFTVQPARPRDYLVGSLSGVFTTGMGMPGPPLLLYFAGTRMHKTVLRSTTLAFFLFVYAISLAMQVALTSTEQKIWLSALILLPVAAVGTVLGQLLFRYINQAVFRVITLVILGVTGSYLFVSSI